ncbi:hypothetical protein DDP54_17795 [Cellulomonas sp. WB94]|uniref:DUF1206 domain-containing protein n=1 Tax=Cellulomonas sp. WB94 TaxID=2173174 RepID=UPI000D57986E|nr:DUF1206 domain-containing protein [Cellulomonas sp. WB94]PVU81186.1 hypothetical protein DDP54_17795 [Cellulomonas sp. WB94]
MTSEGARIVGAGRAASKSRQMEWAARAGLTARAVVYLLIGVLAVLVAQGRPAEVDQKGALAEVISHPFGGWLVGLAAAGFAGYALWRLSEAAFGVVGKGRAVGPRVQSFARGLIYAFLAFSAISLLQGSNTGQSTQQKGYAAAVMAHPGGRWLVGIAGAVVVGVGVALVIEGLRLTFMRNFSALPARVRTLVTQLGRVGTTARGLVFALAGALVVAAAWTYDPDKAGGLDGALKTLRDQPFGPVLLTLVGLGLVAFGLYGLAEARYRRV